MEGKNIYQAIAAIMEEGGVIGKDKQNLKQGFRYRGVDDVMNVFHPIMAKHGVFVVPEVIAREREERQTERGGTLLYSILTIRFTFYAADGSYVSATVVGEGMDSGDKASNKAMSVAFKYALFQTFCIPTEEMADNDPDKSTPEPSTKAQKKKQEAQKDDHNETDAKELEIIEAARAVIETIVDADTATLAITPLMAIQHVGNSRREVGKILAAKVDALGLKYDAKAKKYVEVS